MLRGFLIKDSAGDNPQKIDIGSTLTLGRSVKCNLVVDDVVASRTHVKITCTEGTYTWEDMGSTNGTLINDHSLLKGVLEDGDRLQIGNTEFLFKMEQTEDEKSPQDNINIHADHMIGWEYKGSEHQSEQRSEDLLRAIYAVMNEIATTYEPCTLVDKILEMTMKAIDAQRGVIIFAGPDDELEPCPSCGRFHQIINNKLLHVKQHDIQVSKTVAKRVLKNGESLLYQSTDNDSELNLAHSIIALKLLSILCVPLKGKLGNLGILYVDTDHQKNKYTQDEMLLTTAVGNSAGLALENATMHQKILDKDRTDQEIQHAWTIQQGFLIKNWPENEERFAIYGETRPAKTVGGDFYDYIQVDKNKVGMLIGDVSGKGVPASLTMAQLLAEFRICARKELSPKAVLQELNAAQYQRSKHGIFCTVFYAILDLENGIVTCANAGHNPAIQISETGVTELVSASGPPIGVIPDIELQNKAQQLKSGDTLLLYTDGIAEARKGVESESIDRIIKEFDVSGITSSCAHLHNDSPNNIITSINKAVLEYCSPQVPNDDCTMIALKYLV